MSSINNSLEKNILIGSKNKINQIFFQNDSLPKKEKHKKKDIPSKLDEKKDVTKDCRKNSILAVIGLILGVFSFASVIWILLSQSLFFIIAMGFIGLISSILGLGFSFWSLSEIKNHGDKYEGKLLAIAGIVLCSIFLIVALIFEVK